MKNTNFKTFLAAVKTEPDNAPVWYAGYLFLDLTPRQHAKTCDALLARGCAVTVDAIGRRWVHTPVGLGLLL